MGVDPVAGEVAMHERGATAYYRLYAARCLEMSREASNEANRTSLLIMAQTWMALADQADRSRDIAPEAVVPEPIAPEAAPQVAQQQQQPQPSSSTER